MIFLKKFVKDVTENFCGEKNGGITGMKLFTALIDVKNLRLFSSSEVRFNLLKPISK